MARTPDLSAARGCVLGVLLGTLVLACGPRRESDQEREAREMRAFEGHRWIHEVRAYESDLDIDAECAVCHEPAALQLFREKRGQPRPPPPPGTPR